ncbi:hypothetical protein [Sorangium cellulosum]|uniref:hypothetical protein n=1 Tax=Sorangium cellulosum TaxID=56 RepID=UPI000CF561F7|nr:hypothetical protein [Sorangium cellulosum]
MLDFFKDRRRAALRREPFPEAWSAILERNVPYLRRRHRPSRPGAGRREEIVVGPMILGGSRGRSDRGRGGPSRPRPEEREPWRS